MKNKATLAVALVCATLLAASGCTLRLHGSASTSVKGKAVHTGEPKGEDPAHPTTKAKPVHTGSAVAASAEVHIALPVPKLSAGVTDTAAACPNTTEVTNGIDDDCDGQIDENEAGSGPMQITLWWDNGSDLDLKVIDPTGAEIGVKNKKSNSGGFMDLDSRGTCTNGKTIENVYWTDAPPKGNYVVKVRYYSYCKDKTEPPTNANVTVSYQGQILGPYSLEMNYKDDVEILEFNLDQ